MTSQVRRVSCGFCKNAGFYGRKAAHLVKDCPVLAKTECRYCHTLGHTKSRCQVLKEKNMRKKQGGFRKASFKRRSNGRNLFDHVDQALKTPKPVVANEWSLVQGRSNVRKPAAKRSCLNKHSQNSFAVLEENSAPKQHIALPTVVEVEEPLKGAWANKLGSKKSVEEPKVIEEPKQELTAMQVLQQLRVQPALMVNWGDAAMEEDDSDNEEEIVYDSVGRPSTDNSAW